MVHSQHNDKSFDLNGYSHNGEGMTREIAAYGHKENFDSVGILHCLSSKQHRK